MKDAKATNIPDLAAGIDMAVGLQSPGHLEIDLDHYQGFLADSSLTPEQKAEIIGALWTIISVFVELGFGVHPVQQACGKHGTELDQTRNSEST